MNSSTDKIAAITRLVQELGEELDDLQLAADLPAPQPIESLAELGERLNARRKKLNLDLATLELQTGISVSTLKRLFKNPEQVKFGSVHLVARTLGVRLCSVV